MTDCARHGNCALLWRRGRLREYGLQKVFGENAFDPNRDIDGNFLYVNKETVLYLNEYAFFDVAAWYFVGLFVRAKCVENVFWNVIF